MDKATALAAAADAVSVLSQVAADYGSNSPELAGAINAMHDTFIVAQDHGATDADLRNTGKR